MGSSRELSYVAELRKKYNISWTTTTEFTELFRLQLLSLAPAQVNCWLELLSAAYEYVRAYNAMMIKEIF